MKPLLQPGGPEETSLTSPADQRTPPSRRGWDPGQSLQPRESGGSLPGMRAPLEMPPPHLGTLPPPRVGASVRVCETTKCM